MDQRAGFLSHLRTFFCCVFEYILQNFFMSEDSKKKKNKGQLSLKRFLRRKEDTEEREVNEEKEEKVNATSTSTSTSTSILASISTSISRLSVVPLETRKEDAKQETNEREIVATTENKEHQKKKKKRGQRRSSKAWQRI
ncbi:hypothetical protein RFI_26053 [Reticulomyxa filosa]|uniref:Uncharacterized protein n=1 Tax=Reticulomyxa filosa TaxID=46433 RepID=X6MBS3_RETFI|nr:hypothetical protein RFI_26053 [Reticulomyxa filosa]|eukprot:ETO11319.1 hypothetical protein RFI_26053 [Reticulomyxa filosa]